MNFVIMETIPQTLLHPPKTMLEIWESLPERTLYQLINNKLIMSPASLDIQQVVLGEFILKSAFI